MVSERPLRALLGRMPETAGILPSVINDGTINSGPLSLEKIIAWADHSIYRLNVAQGTVLADQRTIAITKRAYLQQPSTPGAPVGRLNLRWWTPT